MLVGLFGVGTLMLSWPFADTLVVAMGLIALTGFVDGPGLAATFGARQAWTPPHLLGQIFTTAVSMKVGALSLGAAVAGPAVVTLGAGSSPEWRSASPWERGEEPARGSSRRSPSSLRARPG